jgi:D-xylose transport system substrate-binding protein
MKKLKLIQKIIYITLIFSVVCSCQQKSGSKIGFMFPHTTGSRMAIEEKIFKAKATELGCEVIVTDAKNDENLQREQARELIDKGVSVLVVMAVNAYTAAEIVRDAHNAGIKVIAYDRLISNCDLDFYLSFNNYNVGKYMAEYALKLKPEGKYILLEGDKSDKNAVKVRQGHVDAIQSAVQSGKIKVIYDVFTENWDNDNAYQEMKNYLNLSSHEIPDVILCANDGLANSAKNALLDLGIKENIVITGQDAEPTAIKNIMHDKQTMTIYKPLKVLAENAVITAVKLMKNEKLESTETTNNSRIEVPSLLFDPVVVDKSNIKQTVVADGVIKESDFMN